MLYFSKVNIFLCLFVCMYILAGCNNFSDSNLSKNLIGKWLDTDTVTDQSGEEVDLYSITTYTDNGLLLSTIDITTIGRTATIVIRGTWEIKDGRLHQIVTSSSNEKLVPVGTDTDEEIIEITKEKFVHLTKDGELSESFREK